MILGCILSARLCACSGNKSFSTRKSLVSKLILASYRSFSSLSWFTLCSVSCVLCFLPAFQPAFFPQPCCSSPYVEDAHRCCDPRANSFCFVCWGTWLRLVPRVSGHQVRTCCEPLAGAWVGITRLPGVLFCWALLLICTLSLADMGQVEMRARWANGFHTKLPRNLHMSLHLQPTCPRQPPLGAAPGVSEEEPWFPNEL